MSARQFGEKLKEARVAKGQTQTELGDILGVGLKQVQRYEKGELLPDHDKIRQLVGLYNVDFVGIIYDGLRPTEPMPAKYEKLMEERVLELKEDKEWLKRNFEISLAGIGTQAASILAHVATSLEKDDEREAAGSKEKLQQLKKDTGRRIGEKLGQGDRKSIKASSR
jgi:transcriptional regulator with XRE-family HTH domain